MTSNHSALVVGPEAAGALHARDLPQKDNLCGCFWGAIALWAAGVETVDAEPVDQDRVALEAGTVLPEGDPATFVPPGESSRHDYRLELPTAEDPADGGTAAPSLGAAVERLSGGRLAVVPIAGPWSPASLTALVRTAAELSPSALLVANVRTGPFWGTRPDPSVLLAYLGGSDPKPPEAEWDVGHFVNVAGLLSAGERALVLVRDSYRSLGWSAHHLQPAEAFAAALRRDDGREGGILCVVPSADGSALRERLAQDGFELRDWDNGSPPAAGEHRHASSATSRGPE